MGMFSQPSSPLPTFRGKFTWFRVGVGGREGGSEGWLVASEWSGGGDHFILWMHLERKGRHCCWLAGLWHSVAGSGSAVAGSAIFSSHPVTRPNAWRASMDSVLCSWMVGGWSWMALQQVGQNNSGKKSHPRTILLSQLSVLAFEVEFVQIVLHA